MKLSSKQKGNITELQCLTAFCNLGYTVNIPYGDNSKYDFIADIDGKLLKVQVKTASLKGTGAIKFSCRAVHVNCRGVSAEKYPKGEVDYFATFWEGKCYLVPAEECSAEKTLRFSNSKNNQKQSINPASFYELQNQVSIIKSSVYNKQK